MSSIMIEVVNEKADDRKRLYEWQKTLMLWTALVPTSLIVVFIVIATLQLNKFSNQIAEKKDDEFNRIIDPSILQHSSINSEIRLQYIKWYSLTKMEEIAMNKRYHQGGLLIMS